MVVDELIRHIELLLVSNDCVVVPGLGAVIAHSVPARFDDCGLCLMPPARTFTFNAGLTQNDGLLLSSISRAKSISYDAARRFVSMAVDDMHRQLSSSGSLSLGKVGALSLDPAGSLLFTPNRPVCFSPSYMWLQPLRLQSVNDLVRNREAVVSGNDYKISPLRRYVVRAARVAASLALLLALGFMLSTPIQFKDAQYASFGIENFKSSGTDDRLSDSEFFRRPGESSSALVIVLGCHSDASEVADTASHNAYKRSRQTVERRYSLTDNIPNIISETEQVRFNPDDKYCLVVASLASEAEALKYVEKSKNNQLGILAKDGRYRVYAATGETSRQAQSHAKTLADRYPGAWVCRK